MTTFEGPAPTPICPCPCPGFPCEYEEADVEAGIADDWGLEVWDCK